MTYVQWWRACGVEPASGRGGRCGAMKRGVWCGERTQVRACARRACLLPGGRWLDSAHGATAHRAARASRRDRGEAALLDARGGCCQWPCHAPRAEYSRSSRPAPGVPVTPPVPLGSAECCGCATRNDQRRVKPRTRYAASRIPRSRSRGKKTKWQTPAERAEHDNPDMSHDA